MRSAAFVAAWLAPAERALVAGADARGPRAAREPLLGLGPRRRRPRPAARACVWISAKPRPACRARLKETAWQALTVTWGVRRARPRLVAQRTRVGDDGGHRFRHDGPVKRFRSSPSCDHAAFPDAVAALAPENRGNREGAVTKHFEERLGLHLVVLTVYVLAVVAALVVEGLGLAVIVALGPGCRARDRLLRAGDHGRGSTIAAVAQALQRAPDATG